MKTLTDRQKAVVRYLALDPDMPSTVREIAEALHHPEGSIRSALASLEKHGCVERRGISLTGGATWAPL